jgi:hypothetical protein
MRSITVVETNTAGCFELQVSPEDIVRLTHIGQCVKATPAQVIQEMLRDAIAMVERMMMVKHPELAKVISDLAKMDNHRLDQ